MKTSYSFRLKARPDELLVDHALQTANSCREKMLDVLPSLGIPAGFLKNVSYLIGLGHDLGKATTYFQKRLEDPSFKTAVTNHSELSAMITWDLVQQYGTQNKCDPELVKLVGVLAYLVVRKHHGAIGNAENILETDADEDVLEKQLGSLDIAEVLAIIAESEIPVEYQWNKEVLLKLRKTVWKSWDKLLDYSGMPLYYLHKLFFSALVASDKGSVILQGRKPSLAQGDGSKIPMIEHYKKKFNGDSTLDIMREELYQEALRNVEKFLDNPLLSLNMPTGTGKTLTSLAVAYRIKELLNKSGPIIYCLPFTSVIDQNYQVFEEVIENYSKRLPTSSELIKHHYLAAKDYKDAEQEWNPDESRFLIQAWESELIVTTFVQLFHTLAGNGNRQLIKLHRLKNAVIILDEVQAIPVKYWCFIRKVLKTLAQELQCHIILVTATLPLIFDQSEIKNLITKPQAYFQKVNRTKLKLYHTKPLLLQDFYHHLECLIEQNNNKDILIVLNTIQSAAQVYDYLKDKEYQRDYFYLSSYVVPKERTERLKQLKDKKNKKQKPKLIVTTQLIEAGVDLDVGLVIRDFGPLDAINQVAGRCNRHWNRSEAEQVYIFRLLNDKGKDFAFMIYDPILLLATQECLNGASEVPEQDYWLLNNKYFEKLKIKRSEEDKKLIDLAGRLEHDTVSRSFQLIEDLPKTPVFIQLDAEAEKLWQKYLAMINEKEAWQQKEAFSEFKKEFMEYVINVTEKDTAGLSQVEDFYLISKEQLNDFYHLETGFIRKG
ncbi:CRISPR-associated helicase Cas3' [Bacillota bacterium LX-D]|nr:CRISPR-associated helicase Cas3' [Bacillota bacterium LX-D]